MIEWRRKTKQLCRKERNEIIYSMFTRSNTHLSTYRIDFLLINPEYSKTKKIIQIS